MDDRFSSRSKHSDNALAQTLCDPMFEPLSGFNFAGSLGEEARGLQPTMGSPHAPYQKQQAYFSPVNGTSFNSDFHFSDIPNQFTQNIDVFEQSFGLLSPAHGWENQGSGGGEIFGTSSPDANSMQQVVQGRKSAKQRFGQITPPDDGMSEFTPSKSTAGETAETEAAERARTDKSERARNAANQRHAETKKIGNDSQANNSVDCCDDEGKAGDEKKKYREKNGLAASKCRAKKKENIKDVEAKHHKLGAMNFSLKFSLKKQVQDLRGELTGLRTHALSHQDCNYQISRYNINQTKKVALGAEVPSPSLGFQGHRDSSLYLRSPPDMEDITCRSNFASTSSFAFASVTPPDDMSVIPGQENSPHFGDYMPSGCGGPSFSQS